MIRLRHKLLIYGLRTYDQLTLAASLFITVALAKGVFSLPQISIVFQRDYKLIETTGLIAMLVSWTLLYSIFIKYDTNSFESFHKQILQYLKASTTTAFLLLLAGVIFKFETLNMASIAIFWCLINLLGLLGRSFIRIALILTRNIDYNRRNVLMVGSNSRAVTLADKITTNPELGYHVFGFVKAPSDSDPTEGLNIVADLDEISQILENEKIDEIIICIPFQNNAESIARVIALSHDLGVVARYIPDVNFANIIKSLNVERFDSNYILTFFREKHILQLLIKRLIDILGSLILLILLSPIFAVVAIAILIDSRGPVLFAQDRVGMNKRRFKLYKFRSMVVNAEELKAKLADQNEVDGPVFKIKKDPRITKVGRLIRKTSVDELPQLWNAFVGNISLVGPRPPLPSEVDQYEWLFRKRLSIKPGITCLWQVSGRNELSFDEWMELDKKYIENWSIWLDIKILLKTIPTVLLGRGAS